MFLYFLFILIAHIRNDSICHVRLKSSSFQLMGSHTKKQRNYYGFRLLQCGVRRLKNGGNPKVRMNNIIIIILRIYLVDNFYIHANIRCVNHLFLKELRYIYLQVYYTYRLTQLPRKRNETNSTKLIFLMGSN